MLKLTTTPYVGGLGMAPLAFAHFGIPLFIRVHLAPVAGLAVEFISGGVAELRAANHAMCKESTL